MLQYPQLCLLDNRNLYGSTALIYACEYNLATVSMKILSVQHEYPCALDADNVLSFTALMHACNKSMESVALEILKTPSKCGLYIKSETGHTAFSLAQQNGLISVAKGILDHNMYNKKNSKRCQIPKLVFA